MLPTLGETAKFTFISAFNKLDGIYTILSINTLNELLELGVSLVDTTYKEAEIADPENQYQTDLDTFKSDQIYKLKHIESEVVIYVPTSFNELVPDPNVKQYIQIGMGVDVGIFKDPTRIEWIKSQIAQALAAVAGVEKDPTLFEISTVWMTEAEYQVIEDERNSTIADVTNHYTDKQKLILENTRLRTQLAEYENTIKILSGG